MDYPYIQNYKHLEDLLKAITVAERPPKFTSEFLRKLGFTSTNDRAFVRLLKELGFLGEDGTPTEKYDSLRDPREQPSVLAEQMRDLYRSVLALNQTLWQENDSAIRTVFARATGKGKDEISLKRMVATFQALSSHADFGAAAAAPRTEDDEEAAPTIAPAAVPTAPANAASTRAVDFVYRIELHLPATTDIAVYNAIFRSLREHLLQ